MARPGVQCGNAHAGGGDGLHHGVGCSSASPPRPTQRPAIYRAPSTQNWLPRPTHTCLRPFSSLPCGHPTPPHLAPRTAQRSAPPAPGCSCAAPCAARPRTCAPARAVRKAFHSPCLQHVGAAVVMKAAIAPVPVGQPSWAWASPEASALQACRASGEDLNTTTHHSRRHPSMPSRFHNPLRPAADKRNPPTSMPCHAPSSPPPKHLEVNVVRGAQHRRIIRLRQVGGAGEEVEAGARVILLVAVGLQQLNGVHLQQQVDGLGLCGCE